MGSSAVPGTRPPCIGRMHAASSLGLVRLAAPLPLSPPHRRGYTAAGAASGSRCACRPAWTKAAGCACGARAMRGGGEHRPTPRCAVLLGVPLRLPPPALVRVDHRWGCPQCWHIFLRAATICLQQWRGRGPVRLHFGQAPPRAAERGRDCTLGCARSLAGLTDPTALSRVGFHGLLTWGVCTWGALVARSFSRFPCSPTRVMACATLSHSMSRTANVCAPSLPPAPFRPADVEISYVDAILGTTVKVTTLGADDLSQVDLKIPAGEHLPVCVGCVLMGCVLQLVPCRRRMQHQRDAPACLPARFAPLSLLRKHLLASLPSPPPRSATPPFALACPSHCRHATGHHAGHVEAWRAQAGHHQRPRRPPGARQGQDPEERQR